MDIKAEITAQFKQVAKEHDKQLAPLTESLALLDSGLDSLCFAILVARLEDGKDDGRGGIWQLLELL